ncbi:hypothetical protein CA267_008110 [Alteromonas pelagimontana]|uniref:Secreted protein n=1 Tax=Alteromonas pelagimontana TaxID=1858656 RepID=A0A6M4MC69_9ALTE|nr:hypothetical protein [Alteromonas pelagimontana]QJR80743.1 hypothetical protein CA267_008110 [Alteromonas pelagimontana]
MSKFFKMLALSSLVLGMTACDVNKTEDGEMPDVEADSGNMPEYEIEKTEEGRMPSVDVEGGEMPEYDVDTADVDIGTEKKVVTVPEVDVTMPDEDDDEPEDDDRD